MLAASSYNYIMCYVIPAKKSSMLAVMARNDANTARLKFTDILDKVNGRTTASVAQMVVHQTHYSKLARSAPAGGKLLYHPLNFLDIYIIITTSNIPYTLFGLISCWLSLMLFVM